MPNEKFKIENIFFLVGHGTENLRDPQRYKLLKNQYAAIAVNPGEQLISNKYFFSKIYNDFSTIDIEIPKGSTKMVNNLGFGDYLGAEEYDKKIVYIENFKLYRPKMSHRDKQKLWYTLPDMYYKPTAVWPIKDQQVIHGVYKGVSYDDLVSRTFRISGILRQNFKNGFNTSDIDDFDQAYGKENSIPFPTMKTHKLGHKIIQKYELIIHYPKGTIDKKIVDLINNKTEDPLAYDLYCWIKAAFKGSVIPLNDFLLMYYCISNNKTIDCFKDLKKELNHEEQEKLINKTFTLRNIFNMKFKFGHIYQLLEDIVKPEGPYILISFNCRSTKDVSTRTKKSAKKKSRPGYTRKLKRVWE